MIARLNTTTIHLTEVDQELLNVGHLDLCRCPPLTRFDTAFDFHNRVLGITRRVVPRLQSLLKIINVILNRLLHFDFGGMRQSRLDP